MLFSFWQPFFSQTQQIANLQPVNANIQICKCLGSDVSIYFNQDNVFTITNGRDSLSHRAQS